MDRLPVALGLTLLPGAQRLLQAHAEELPQRDDLCGAFCAALALRAAGLQQQDGEPIDQDAVALLAGSVVSRMPDPSALPRGESGRRDYRIAPPLIDDAGRSGTNCAGVLSAIERISAGRLAAIPCSGRWASETLGCLFDALAGLERPATLIANVATRHLWGGAPRVEQLLDHLLSGAEEGPPADWDVGHFVSVFARAEGPGGRLYVVADTYPSLGDGGVHVQPSARLAMALERPGMTPGGMIAVVSSQDAAAVRTAAAGCGLRENAWDNGSASAGAAQ